MTNYERIKAMSVEEMMEFLYVHCDCSSLIENPNCGNSDCGECWKAWLERECDE